jgi:quercetin dioxygenase-like cupin family protein
MSVTKIQECSECTIVKGWGHELIIHNSEKYCGKLLVFKAGCKFSMHYHLIKQETWYVNKGTFIYRWIDTNQGTELSTRLTVGDVVTQYPGQPHQLEALEDGEIFEVSTQHFDTDSYRIWKGD